MTIGKKLQIGYGVVLLLLVVVTAVGIYGLRYTQVAYEALVDENTQIVDRSNRLGRAVRDQIASFRGYLLYAEDREALEEEIRASHIAARATIRAMQAALPASSSTTLLDEIMQLEEQLETAVNQGLALAAAGQDDEARAFGAQRVSSIGQALVERADAFRRQQAEIVAADRAALISRGSFVTWLMVLVSGTAILAAVLIATWIGRGISHRLQESATQLSTSAAEILATTTQLSSGAIETDTAVTETTTTVEEVKQTAQLASKKARQVLDSAEQAAQVVATGQKSVEATIAGMHHIQEQMEAIADSIMRLSEQSQTIGEIISVVNNLAEQSNLLAVNAAIEAARAGEHGKGFAVVSQEVKSLADQSKKATSQVRSILGEIQKATNSAVLATEQGGKAVDAGVIQSTETGEVIRVLAEGVTDAADAATQIAASSQQQMVGMDQIAGAMDNIKQASGQNVAGAKQAEVAAQDLHELGRKLIAMVGVASANAGQ